MRTLTAPEKAEKKKSIPVENENVMTPIDPKPHAKGEGVKLVGSPEDLVNLMIVDKDKRREALEQLINEGPKHKQVLSALLLTRLYKLIKSIEKSSGTKFEVQKGNDFKMVNKEEKEYILPLNFPISISDMKDMKKVAEAISHAPEHEALAYALCLQGIEWAIKTAEK